MAREVVNKRQSGEGRVRRSVASALLTCVGRVPGNLRTAEQDRF